MEKHPQIVEAEKRLEAAKEAYGQAVTAIDRQYLKPLVGGDPSALKDVNRLRRSFVDVSEVADIAPAAALEQPAAPAVAPKKGRTKK